MNACTPDNIAAFSDFVFAVHGEGHVFGPLLRPLLRHACLVYSLWSFLLN